MGDSVSQHQHPSASRLSRDVEQSNGFGQTTSRESSGSQLQHMPAGRLSRGIEETHGLAQTQLDSDQMPRPSKRRRRNMPSDNQFEPESKGKRKLASGISDDKSEKRVRLSTSYPDAGSINFQEIQNPPKVCCLLQVNFGELVGSLTTSHGGYGIWLYLNGGKERSPNIGLVFKVPESDGPEVGRINWYIDSRAEDRWVIQDFQYGLVTEAPIDTAISNKKARDQCDSAESLARLMCITLSLTSHAGGSCSRPDRNASQAMKTCLNTIFWKHKDYTLRIWFVIPRKNVSDIDANCLRVMSHLFSIRQRPLSHAQDRNGIYFVHSDDDINMASSAALALQPPTSEPPKARTEAENTSIKAEAEGSSGETEREYAGLWDIPPFNQGIRSELPHIATNERFPMPSQRPLAYPTVPSFGLSLPPRLANASAPYENATQLLSASSDSVPPKSTLPPSTLPPNESTSIAPMWGEKGHEAEDGEINEEEPDAMAPSSLAGVLDTMPAQPDPLNTLSRKLNLTRQADSQSHNTMDVGSPAGEGVENPE